MDTCSTAEAAVADTVTGATMPPAATITLPWPPPPKRAVKNLFIPWTAMAVSIVPGMTWDYVATEYEVVLVKGRTVRTGQNSLI